MLVWHRTYQPGPGRRGGFFFACEVGMGLGYFFQHFCTSIVLLMGPRLIFGWYKIGTKLVLPQVPTRLVLVWVVLPQTVRVLARSVDSVIGQINTHTRRRPAYQTNTPLECRTSEAHDQYRVCWSSFVQ